MPRNEPNYGEHFDGDVYVPEIDDVRLTGQLQKVYECMKDGRWRTLVEICEITGIILDASVSKQLRHLRYERFGSYFVDLRRVGDAKNGLWEYRVGPKGSGVPHHPICLQCAQHKREMKSLKEDNKRLRLKANRLIGKLRDAKRSPAKSVGRTRKASVKKAASTPARRVRVREQEA